LTPSEVVPRNDHDFVERHLRWNVLALGADYGLFMVGMAFMSAATILPAFAASLGASTVLIGAIPAVMTIGWYLPPLFAAAHTERLSRKLPYVLKWTGWERVPFLVLAGVAFFVADRAPAVAMTLLLVLLLLMTAVGGMLMPAWTDLVARTLPPRLRGRFFGLASLGGTLGGLAGSALTARVLGTLPSSTAFGVCFLIAAFFVGISWIALALVREPPAAAAPAQADFWTHLHGIPALLRRDRNFSRHLAGRALMFGASVGGGFLTVYALRVLGAAAADVALFTALLLAGQMLGQLALGWVGDHAGHRLVLAIAGAAAATLNVIALSAGSLSVFVVVFALHGFYNAALQVSAVNVLFDFAPTPEQNPTYVGIERTFLAPFGFALPLAGGVFIDTLGYGVVFGASAACAAVSAAILWLLVREPRASVAAPRVRELPG
jgi:MFS family permease